MIELKLKTIVENIDVFKELSTKELSAFTAFHIAHILDKITQEYNLFQKTREKMINKYGDHDENGNLIIDNNGQIHLGNEEIKIFNEEMVSLLETIIKINEEPIKLKELSQAKFTPAQIYILQSIIEE